MTQPSAISRRTSAAGGTEARHEPDSAFHSARIISAVRGMPSQYSNHPSSHIAKGNMR